MHLISISCIGLIFLIASMACTWMLVRKTNNGGLTDVVWTFSLGLTGLFFCFAVFGHEHSRAVLCGFLISLWTLRLGLPLWRRNVGGAEDARYTALRDQWGQRFWQRLFGLLMLQAGAAFLLALTVMFTAYNPLPLGVMDALGGCVMFAALWGGHRADQQLASFKRNKEKHGQICDIGLWGRSRHPNYFFETMFWSGWPFLAVSGGWWFGICTVAGPMFIYWLLRHVSGEPLVEAHMARRYGHAFNQYKARVPPFFPRLFL